MASSPSLGTSTLRSGRKAKLPTQRTEPSRTSMDLPERFRGDEEEAEGEQEDGGKLAEDSPEAYVQQSMYGIIAAAQRKLDFGARFGAESGSEEESDEEAAGKAQDSKRRPVRVDLDRKLSSEDNATRPEPESSKHRKNKSEGRLLRSFLRPIRERGNSHGQDAMTQSQILQPKEEVIAAIDRPLSAGVRRDAPIMDRKLQAQAKAEMDSSITSSDGRRSRDGTQSETARRRKAPVPLSHALAEIFQFPEPEEVISEYPCWYLQNVLLQGYMYITQKHVCFYAYLQKKANNITKSGHLGKQGKRNPRYRRYWFALKGDVLSYYTSAADPYFPNGTIDLRYGISAELVPENSKDTVNFTVTTDKRTYHFRADSATSAKEWVRQLQKVIFRSHNDGDSVKISLPIENIVDVEPNPVIDFAETVRLRVIDNDETYAVDEYFFTFFSHGKDALNVLTLMTQGNDAKKATLEEPAEEPPVHNMLTSPFRRSMSVERSPRLSQGTAPALPEPVRSTLSPLPVPGRSSGEVNRSSGEVSRTSFDRGRASFDRGKRSVSGTSRTSDQWRRPSKSPLSPSAEESTESFLTSSEHASGSPTTTNGAQMDMSASQMLGGDGMFRAPTLRMPQPRRTFSGSTVERLRAESREQSPQSPGTDRIQIQPPSRVQTEQTLSDAISAKQSSAKTRPSIEATSASATRSTRAIATPLQHAFTLAGVVRDKGKQMSSYLSSSPKSYYDKFSDAIAGGKRHYSEQGNLGPEDRIEDPEDDLDAAEDERRFQQHFALPASEKLRAVYFCWLHRVLPLYGKIYVSDRRFCFRSLLYGTRTKLVVPFKDIVNVHKDKGFRWAYPGMVLVIRGHEELFFDFSSRELRDDCVVTMLRSLDVVRAVLESVVMTEEERLEAETAAAEDELLRDARQEGHGELVSQTSSYDDAFKEGPPMLFDDPTASVLDFMPKTALNITCLTIGSRGDVQPYIALGKGLIADGHRVKIATHTEFEGWIRKHGLDFAPVAGSPQELMRLCTENGMFTPSFLYEVNAKSREWLDGLLATAWEACQGSDLLIESPSAMAGIHIAEALKIPYFRAFTMPWTRTRAYPHAFAGHGYKMGGGYNYMSYGLFDNMFWAFTAGQINKWRMSMLKIPATNLSLMQPNKVPFLYNFSPSVVVPPLDFSDWIRVTGYWFLDEAGGWTPPDDLAAFIQKARDDNMKLVYVGFGSVPVTDSKALTQQIVDAVLKADVRCILSKGWSDHFDRDEPHRLKATLPPAIFQIRQAPHDWLFRQIDAAVHHGGAGTTGASLRAGVPTVVRPFFGDQHFFGARVEDLGVGICIRKTTAHALGKAMWIATHDERMRAKARALGEQIRAEDGVQTAITAIYRDLEYARTLIKNPALREEELEDLEETWTFVEDVSDVDVMGSSASVASPRRGSGVVGGTKKYEMGMGSRQPSLGSVVLRGRVT